MSTESIQITEQLPVSANRVYTAWLDSTEHTAMTGGTATAEPIADSDHSAWDGYITGKTLELEEGKRILQSWRTSEFPQDAEDSLLEILLQDNEHGCLVTLNHSNIPEGQGEQYNSGWKDHYFDPMKVYFSA